SVELRVRTDVAAAHASVRAMTRRIGLLRNKVQPAAQRALDAARVAYATGPFDIFSLLEAERSLLDVEVEIATTRTDLLRRLADLDFAAGQRLPRAPALSAYESIDNGSEVHHAR